MLILVVLSIFPLLGLFLMGLGVRNVWRGVASTSWPKTSGVVVAPVVAESTSEDSQTGATSTTNSTTVTVAYKVDGREYKTDTMHFGETVSSDASEAEMARLRYPPGAEVPVAYHPQNPAIAAVKPGFAAEALTLPVVGLAILLMGVLPIFAIQSSSGQGQGMSNMIPRIFGGIFMLVGVTLLTIGVRRLWRDHESETWPKAPGVILFSTTTSSTSESRDSDGTTSTGTSYNSPLVVEYEVNGRKHYSNTRRFGQLAGSGEKWAAEIAERYPKGAQVQVSYSPADPDQAVLEPGITSEGYWLPGAGAAFFLFGLIAVLVIRF